MLHALVSHADCNGTAVDKVDVQMTRHANGLVLQYALHGAIDELKIPPVAESRRIDELWQHTCCEIFLRAVSDEAYYEYNFSPSTEWAAYRFDSYRSGMKLASISAPVLAVRKSRERLEMRASLELGTELSTLELRVGLAAVIEDIQGRKAYWALTHSAGKPDFHHPDSFAVLLSNE